MSNRRKFIKQSALIAGTSLFPSILIPRAKKELGVALVGLGYYSRDLLAPALQLTQHCKLKGIITGSPEKIPVWQDKYGIADGNVYNYENMHTIANNDEIDVIYIVLPNSLHMKYSVIAAEAGKHVWCEKPMAKTVAECQQIINSCRENKVKLSIGYRMQHEPNTQTIIGYGQAKPYGDITNVIAKAGFRNNNTDHWKLKKEMGGGAMMDMGVYTLNAARYCTQEEPISVRAHHETTRPEIYKDADETTIFSLRFPSGATAECMTTFGENINTLRVDCEKGWYALDPFSSYTGIKGVRSDGTLLNQSIPNEQSKQMDDDSLAIMNNTKMLVPGEEGLLDMRVVEAIYESASKNGRRVEID